MKFFHGYNQKFVLKRLLSGKTQLTVVLFVSSVMVANRF